MKYFVLSDIHGHFKEMMQALNKANFEVSNNNHQLIINGDMFDRGGEIKEVFDFLYSLNQTGKAFIIKGNHEVFLEEFLEGNQERVNFNCFHNGFKETLLAFIPSYDLLSFDEARQFMMEKYPYLKEWLHHLPYYFETKQYVITHAGLDFSQGDFKLGDFKKAIWTKPEKFFEVDLVKNYKFYKSVVVGHRFTCTIRNYFHPSEHEDYSIYYHDDNQKIGIDGGSYYSKHINVFEFEEEI